MQEKRFLQQNWLLSPASCGKAEAGVRARDQSWDEKRLFWSEDPCPKGYSTACRQEMSASPMHLPKTPAAPGAKSRSAEGARAGCWSPAASPHP